MRYKSIVFLPIIALILVACNISDVNTDLSFDNESVYVTHYSMTTSDKAGSCYVAIEKSTYSYAIFSETEELLYSANGNGALYLLSKQENKLYFTEHDWEKNVFYKVLDLITLQVQNFYPTIKNEEEEINPIIYKDNMYYQGIKTPTGCITQADLSGTYIKDIKIESKEITLKGIVNDRIYYYQDKGDMPDVILMSCDINGENQKILLDSSSFEKESTSFEDIRIEKDILYTTIDVVENDEDGKRFLYQLDLNSLELKKLTDDDIREFAIGKEFVFYTNSNQKNRIYKIQKGTTGGQLFVNKKARNLVTANDWLYFLKDGEGVAPSRIKQTGNNLEPLGFWG